MKIKFLSLSNFLILFSIIGAWWIVAFKIEPFLLYYGQQIGFNASFGFLKEKLCYPGGISNYLADFIAQFFIFNNFGSFLIVAIASVQGFLTLNIISRIKGKTNLRYSIFTVTLLLGTLVLADYNYPYHASIRLLFVFLFTWGFSVINKKLPLQSLYMWPVVALLLFYVASGAALIVFAVASIFILIQTRQKKLWMTVSPLFLFFAGIIPLLAYKFVFTESLLNLYKLIELQHPEIPEYKAFYQLYAYFIILPLILLITVFTKENQKSIPVIKPAKGSKPVKNAIYKKLPVFIFAQVIVCAALGYFIFSISFYPVKKKLLYIEYYAETQQWNEVLKVAESIKTYDIRVNYQVAHAYAQLGQLPDKLFYYPQLLGSRGIIFDSSMINGSSTMLTSDLYFELGHMNEAAHWAFEAQTLMPNSPRVLKRLVMIYLVNRKYDLAEKFLNVLDQNMLYKKWVDKYEKYISDTTLANNDPVIAAKRRFNPQIKEWSKIPVNNLKLLVDTNKDNRLAYDYLLSVCMLDSNFPGFISYVKNYRYYNIKTLPASWAEALSVYILKNKSMPSFVSEETISKECLQGFAAFNNLIKQNNNNKDAAKNNIRKDFENTYWYYLLFLDPKVTNVFNDKKLIR